MQLEPGRAGELTMDVHGDDILVIGYLSAVAAALDEQGIVVITLDRDEQHPDVLSGTLVLHPSTARVGHGWGPTLAVWHQNTGWSIQFHGGINGHLTEVHYLHAELVPSPAVVARFIAAVAAGRDNGASAPLQFACNRQEAVTRIEGFHLEGGRGRGDPALLPVPSATTDDAPDAMPIPGRTPQQRRATLAKAAFTRAARRQLREQIARGELSIAAVLDRVEVDPVVAKTRVADLLSALPGYDPVTVAGLLSNTGIHPDRRAGGLGRRQRQALLDAVR